MKNVSQFSRKPVALLPVSLQGAFLHIWKLHMQHFPLTHTARCHMHHPCDDAPVYGGFLQAVHEALSPLAKGTSAEHQLSWYEWSLFAVSGGDYLDYLDYYLDAFSVVSSAATNNLSMMFSIYVVLQIQRICMIHF